MEAISQAELTIFEGDEYRAVVVNRWVTTKRIEFYEAELTDCSEPGITIFKAPALDSHLEASYEDQQSGMEDL